MATIIKKFSDDSVLEYDRGVFDDWCVYLARPSMRRYPPRDIHYFSDMRQLSGVHGSERVYGDFVTVYDRTTKQLDAELLSLITDLCRHYHGDALLADITLSTVYAGMVAEENKERTKLGKRVKRLGVHQVLLENTSPADAAVFSKGKRWMELNTLMKSKGF